MRQRRLITVKLTLFPPKKITRKQSLFNQCTISIIKIVISDEAIRWWNFAADKVNVCSTHKNPVNTE